MKPSVFDVAKYVLKKRGPTTHVKLQKLLYYAQAWSLVWDEGPLFKDRIEAWANGPVVPALFVTLQGRYRVDHTEVEGKTARLSKRQRRTIGAVLRTYGDKDPQWLSDLTHMERPWLDARRGVPPGDRGGTEIAHADMVEYYGGL